ncbi:hypothetical protein LIER_38180 [Lithospermum erythrorhizon]|uniref:Uncharacterized protein n=1 Tax=Lithospermum erythrorhizon TaxID=34254 RepID=A0AAV3PVR4_LITER
MAMSIINAYILVLIVVILPFASEANWWDKDLPPSLAPQLENICNEVNCGKGKCEAAPGEPFSFKCNCDAGWKRTRFDDDNDDDDLEFLPCLIPNCSLDYSCMPAPSPAPPVPNNKSFFDPCYWTYCGEGTCMKNATHSHTHTCQCNPGYNNLLNISAFPCYSDCALGSDCESLGVRVSRSSSNVSPGNDDSQGTRSSSNTFPSNDNNNQATAFLPGMFHWAAILLISATMALWK